MVLSQYLTAIQCSGSMPPQETGLTVNSWYGKFHLEMHWWHAAQFALWNRLPLLEKSLGWYESILLSARERARTQGYRGARWPKMVGPEGRDSPSPIGPLLIWQQPHPIFYAELCYQSRPSRATLRRYREIVFESAEFMASYAHFDDVTRTDTFSALRLFRRRRTIRRAKPGIRRLSWRIGLMVCALRNVGANVWDSAEIRNGIAWTQNFPNCRSATEFIWPTRIVRKLIQSVTTIILQCSAALGVLPGDRVDVETMRRTLKKVVKDWQWDRTWGWDYPMTAMTAARLGEGKLAVDALMMRTEKNRYLANGHNWQRPNLPCYLPGNGGLLYAIALMAGGWRGAPERTAPGFPNDGSWQVRAENFNTKVLRTFVGRTPKAFTNCQPRVARGSALPWGTRKISSQP